MNSLTSKFQLEMFQREHDFISQQVENLEKERNHNRSSDLKMELTSLKKWKLNLKDKIIYMGNKHGKTIDARKDSTFER